MSFSVSNRIDSSPKANPRKKKKKAVRALIYFFHVKDKQRKKKCGTNKVRCATKSI
jgi:hypothetical protein